jgi:hypothetical protein
MIPQNGFTDFCSSLMRLSSSGIKVVRTYSSTERFRVKLEKQTKRPEEIWAVFRAQEQQGRSVRDECDWNALFPYSRERGVQGMS